MKIAYVTVSLPFGRQESFIIPEIREVRRRGHDVVVLPLRPGRVIFHPEAECLRPWTVTAGLLAGKVVAGAVAELFRHPRRVLTVLARIIRKSGTPRVLLKNLLVMPKGLYFAGIVRKHCVDHIHAHWASTPSTAAYVAAQVASVPWSFTAHRWDIEENNLLDVKVSSSKFGRTIDEQGRAEIIARAGGESARQKVITIHMGVEIPREVCQLTGTGGLFTVLCPANFVPKKGHRYLLEAIRRVADAGCAVRCVLAGDGPLERELRALTRTLRLEHAVTFLGRIGHDDLLGMYRTGTVHAVALPSIVTQAGEKEGIPVALMEAMAHGIPVISTDTGGIPELLDGAGFVIAQKDAIALAEGIERLVKDQSCRESFRARGRERVQREFDLGGNVERLVAGMAGN